TRHLRARKMDWRWAMANRSPSPGLSASSVMSRPAQLSLHRILLTEPTMNPHPLFADLLTAPVVIVAGVVLGVVILAVFVAVMSRYTKVGPNEVLVASGMKHKYVDPDGTVRPRGFRIKKGGGTFVVPMLEKVDILSLELMTIDVQTPEVYTSKGVPVKVDGVAQVKIKGDDISIATAAEQFLSKTTEEIKSVAMQTL